MTDPSIVAGLLACGYVVFLMVATHGAYPLSPDTLHNAVLARNLLEGHGYVIQIVQYHVGSFGSVWHVPEMHGLLQPFVLAGLFGLFGVADALVRVPGFLWLGLTGFLTFRLGRRLFGWPAGLLACAVVLGSPYLFLWAWIGTDDVGFACVVVAVVDALDRALRERRGSRFALAGMLSGLALAQKATGIILPVVLLPCLGLLRDVPWKLRLRWATYLVMPVLGVFCLYLARNWFAHGGLSFRWGAIDWFYKSRGLEPYFAIYDTIPSLWAVLQSLGWTEVSRIVTGQLGQFFSDAVLRPFEHLAGVLTYPGIIFPLGIVAIALHSRRHAGFAASSLLALASTVVLVCTIWHYELRFFVHLVPLACVGFAGIDTWVEPWTSRKGPLRYLRAVVLIGLAMAAAIPISGLNVPAVIDPASPGVRPCGDLHEWVGANTGPDDRFLALDPWSLTWETGRPAISVPSGGADAVATILRRYEVDWLVVSPSVPRPGDLAVVQQMVKEFQPAMQMAFDGNACDLYRVDRSAGLSR